MAHAVREIAESCFLYFPTLPIAKDLEIVVICVKLTYPQCRVCSQIVSPKKCVTQSLEGI